MLPSSDSVRRRVLKLLACTVASPAVLARIAVAENETMPETGLPKPLLLEPNSGKSGKFGGVEITLKLSESQTFGNLGSAELVIAPGFIGAPPHYHKHFDEVIRVLEGTVTVLVNGKPVQVAAGGWHLRPRGSVHAFWNAGKIPAKTIELYLPGGHEDYMRELMALFEKDKSPGREAVGALGEKNDVHFVWDDLPAIMDKYSVKL